MTKTQKKAIEKAIKYELPKEQMEMIESEEYFAWFIAILPSFFYDANKNGIPISDSINYVKEHLLYAENRYCTQRNAWAFAQMPQFMLRLENERENLPHATYNYLISIVLNAGNCFQEKDLNDILSNIFAQKEFLKSLDITEQAKNEILNITAWRYEAMMHYAAYCIWHEKKQPQIDNRFCEYYSEEDIQKIDILYKNENGITDLYGMAWRCNMQYEPLERLIDDFEKLSISWEDIVYCVENNISFEESEECNFSIDGMKNLIRKKEEDARKQAYPGFYDIFTKNDGIKEIEQNETTWKLEYRNQYYTYPQNYKKLIEQMKQAEVRTTIDIPVFTLYYFYRNKSLEVCLKKWNKLVVSGDVGGKHNLEVANSCKELKIIIFPNGNIYEEKEIRGNKRLIPLTVKALWKYKENENIFFNIFWNVFKIYAEEKHNTKILNDIEQYDIFLPPITFNELLSTKSLKEAFSGKYAIQKDWNKRDVNLLYVIEKMRRYITDISYKKLLNYNDSNFLARAEIETGDAFILNKKNYSSNNGVKKFVIKWYLERFKCENGTEQVNLWYIIKDYVEMCFISKTKINLYYNSPKKLIEAHDELAKRKYRLYTSPVKVRKDSKFNALREKLPEEFEWIKTRKRLIKETEMQHHCVWSYADKITNDRCAIYSYVHNDGKRYTIEFVQNKKGNYQIEQIQTSCNRGYPKEIKQYINTCLAKAS